MLKVRPWVSRLGWADSFGPLDFCGSDADGAVACVAWQFCLKIKSSTENDVYLLRELYRKSFR